MKKSLGSRIVKEHGLVSNVLPGLNYLQSAIFSGINKRSFEITVPWNARIYLIHYFEAPSSFPKIDEDVSNDVVCKRVKTVIMGEEGYFHG